MKFKKEIKQHVLRGDVLFDIENGYLNPSDFLEEEDAKRVAEAVRIVLLFELEATKLGRLTHI